ncbi:MAG TPA: nitrate reductase [Candidatus Didemnitutus sp.]|nr:nitrate reductase [Candidatus Didemnitutus sp.]
MSSPPGSLFRAQHGPMTSELVLHPGDFGLGRVPARLAPSSTTSMVCGFCSTGCALKVHLDAEGQAVNLTPDPDYPVNQGMACPKGWEALTPLGAPDRATAPLLRQPDGKMASVSWNEALEIFCTRFQEVQVRHGAASMAVLSTGQIVTEEMALLGALAKFGLGVRHLDSNTRQCMATTHVAYKESFGFDAPPYTYADFEESDVLVFFGSNPCIAHPILWQRVVQNRRQPKVIVVDPRRTETAMAASRHYAIRPKSDLTLLYGLANLLIGRDVLDHDFIERHTDGFNAFAIHARNFSPAMVCEATGLTPAELEEFAAAIADRSKRVSFWWTMGINQGHESTRTAQAIINLALLTGQIGKPGTGPNSITGQCNAMGSRLFGNATSLMGGYSFENESDREHVARILGIDAAKIPVSKGWAYDQILDGIEQGTIRGLWVVATDPAHSWIDSERFARLRQRLEFLVVQDMYHSTRTARMADLVLPAAGWGEKSGTFINSERRIGIVHKVARASGLALSDFAIFKLIAEFWGCGEMFDRWTSPEDVFPILQELSRGQPCDFSGIRGYAHLRAAGGIQWPFTAADAQEARSRGVTQAGSRSAKSDNERRLFSDGRFFTPRHRARFVFDEPRPMPEAPDEEFPFLLLTGRGTSAQWHTGSRTNKSGVLRKLAPRSPYAELNPEDALHLRIKAGEKVRVVSRRGETSAVAVVTPTVRAGQVFMPMHFPEVNRLTLAAFDPHSRQPSYKACAVKVVKTFGR